MKHRPEVNVVKGKKGFQKVSSIESFWSKVYKTDSCWIWTGAKEGGRYGSLKVNGKNTKAHRYSWEIHNGKIPEGNVVMHSCDNPKCVNPDHLSVGTTKDNVTDRVQKGRSAIGEKSGASKLSLEQVSEIRRTYKFRVVTKVALAKKFSVAVSTIDSILLNKTWIYA